jgi:urease accessory protein
VNDPLPILRLLQLADSAAPIGGAAHSFGLETLTSEGILRVQDLELFFHDHLLEAGALEGGFCRAAHGLASDFQEEIWIDLNRRLSACKLARESRSASAALGRRFLELVAAIGDLPEAARALGASKREGAEVHHAPAFGLVGAALGLPGDLTVLSYLHQLLAGWISACQRLLPLGQSRAGRLLWCLKPAIIKAGAQSQGHPSNPGEIPCFTPLLEMASMRHPALATRLFIS